MTSKEDIRNWLTSDDYLRFLGLKREDCTHMLVVCDTYDYDDYPVFVTKDEDVHEAVAEHSKNMQRVMEVYSFNHDIEAQLNEDRAFHYD